MAGQNPDMKPVCQFIQTAFPGAVLKEKHHNMLQYQLGISETSLSHVFSCMEEARKDLNIEDYSVSQTTLDQVRAAHLSSQGGDPHFYFIGRMRENLSAT